MKIKKWNKLTINLTNEERYKLKLMAAFLNTESGPLIRTWVEEKLKGDHEKSSKMQDM